MQLHPSVPVLHVIFDAELNAYDAALSEGWPLPRQRAQSDRVVPTLTPFSAFLSLASRRAARERIVA